MSDFVVTKLDKRHTGHKRFQYYISPGYQMFITNADKVLFFLKWRKWCWETFGPGIERDQLLYISKYTTHMVATDQQIEIPKWAWHTPDLRIYFSNDKELSQFYCFWELTKP
jgi:hypothetical protein